MKKYLITLGVMLAATLSLTNCTQEFQTGPDAVKTTYTIYADAADTKTVNDGFSTKWSENDSLNVFHVETGSPWISDNIKFTLADAETCEFTSDYFDGNLAEYNDWYVLYPYNANIIAPSALDEVGYLPVGARVGRPQIQKGNDNMDHIGGYNYPMWGVAKEVSSTELPHIMMTHLSSLVEVVVANNSEVPMTVTSIAFDAPEDITGTYYIGIDEEVPYFISSGEAYVSDVARLMVKDADPIAPGASAKFYFAIKPFIAPAGETLTLTVNNVVKTFDLEQDVAFSSGKVKTLNFNVDEYYAPEPGPYSSNMLWSPEYNASTQEAVVNDVENVQILKLGTADHYGSAVITIPAGTSKIGFYAVSWTEKPAGLSLMNGSEVIGEVYPPVNEGASGNPPYYIDEEETACYFEIPVNAVEESDYVLATSVNKRVLIWGLNYYTADGDLGEMQTPKIVDVTISEFLAAEVSTTQLYRVTGTIVNIKEISAKYQNATLTIQDSESNSLYVYRMKPSEGNKVEDLGLTVGDELTVVGARGEYNGSPQMANGYYESHVDGEEPETEPEVKAVTVAEFLEAAEDETIYELTGVITSVTNTTYGNFYINDGTGEVLIYGLCSPEGATKYWAESGAKVGDTITVQTVRTSYNGTPQGKNAIFVSLVEGEPIEPEEPELKVATVAEFLAAAEDETIYELTGVITSVTNTTYGNFYINDGTGEVLIYGLCSPEGATKYWAESGAKVGDTITVQTVRTSYNGTPQGKNAIFVSLVPCEPEPEPEVPEGSTVASVTIKDLGYANAESVDGVKIALDDNVTIVFAKGGASTAPAYYDSGEAIRMYQNGATLTVSASDKTITSIELTFANKHYYLGADSGELSEEASVRTWTGESSEVLFTSTGTDKSHRAYVSAIKVTYAD